MQDTLRTDACSDSLDCKIFNQLHPNANLQDAQYTEDKISLRNILLQDQIVETNQVE